ncbi:hypothetical protein V5N11_021718 [Cardamine amara subsp. amara]|uniref:Retrotransposon gag domain-containing protein n=1 Tax=Cardamine amara subsp. amara TaxID=228776 RepID=A0ABD1BRZ4_CARAN
MSFVEFQIFDGVAGELRPWISWLEDFFVREDFTVDEKLNLAQSLLEGVAESWFYQRKRMKGFQTWEALKRSLLYRFGNFDDSERIKLIS